MRHVSQLNQPGSPPEAFKATTSLSCSSAKSAIIVVPQCPAVVLILTRGYRIQERSRPEWGLAGLLLGKQRAESLVRELVH